MKKSLVISTLLFAISSLASYADSIQSVTHEIRYERSHANGDAHSGGQIEWTLAKGSIDLSDPGQPGLIFDFDVDRDIYLNSDNDFTDHGWDTQFKLSKSYDWGKFKFIGLEYDQKKTTKNVVSEDYNYTMGPIWKLYGGNLETFLAYDRNSMTDADRWGFDVDYDKTWLKKSGKWGSVSLWNNTELHYRFESKNKTYGYKENNLDFYNETSLLYRTPNYGPFYGSVEAYGEMFANTKDTINRLGTTYKLMPLVGAQWKVDHFSFNPYVSYEVLDKKSTFYKDQQNKYDRADNRRTVTDNNELAIGLIIKWTK
jgi:opacity protein-like surface antigen